MSDLGAFIRPTLTPSSVSALNAHAQLVGTGYNAALLAELCGITVVCDFRSRDIAVLNVMR